MTDRGPVTDLDDLLRPLVDSAPAAPAVGELERRVARRRRTQRRSGAAAVATAMAAVAGLVTGLSGTGRHTAVTYDGTVPAPRHAPLLSVPLPQGSVYFDAITAGAGTLTLSGAQAPSPSRQLCGYVAVDPQTLHLGAAHTAPCADSAQSRHEVLLVTGLAGQGSTNAARIATVDPKTGTVTDGPVIFRYVVASDDSPLTAYAGGWMWVYAITTAGAEVFQVSATTGAVVDTVAAPTIYHASVAADDAGLWIGKSTYPGAVEERSVDTLYRVSPGAHRIVGILGGTAVVTWLQADATHLWAGLAAPQFGPHDVWQGTLSDQSIVAFDGSATSPAFRTAPTSAGYTSVVGDQAEGLWTLTWPTAGSHVPPSLEAARIVYIDPDTGAQTVVATLPPAELPTGTSTQGLTTDQAAVLDGYLYVLLPPTSPEDSRSYATLVRVPLRRPPNGP